MHTLPDAIVRERTAMLRQSLRVLDGEGYGAFEVHELEGYPEPPEVLIPILNVHSQPDIAANEHCGRPRRVLAFVEVSTVLGEEGCGRRWQQMAVWATRHSADFFVFVHAEDKAKAEGIARHWHLDPGCIRPVTGH